MKRVVIYLVLVLGVVLTSCRNSYDDSAIWDRIKDHEARLNALEEVCKELNTNISAMQTILKALQESDYVTSVVPVEKDGVIVGYTITFAKSQPVTIYHGKDGKDGVNGEDGKDGKDGKDGYTPQIGVKQDTDNIYYWTLDGEWLLDAEGNKIKAVGVDGTNGNDGAAGKDGAEGVTPRLKIERDYWYISYDEGATWTLLGKATGEDGKDGANGENGTDGKDGDSFFQSVIQDDECVYLTLADGTVIVLPKRQEDKRVDHIIYYTTSDNKKLFPHDTEPENFGAILLSNIYDGGQGMLAFDDTITSIGDRTFASCERLTNIIIPNGVTSIGEEAFANCCFLEMVAVPGGSSIAQSAFSGCDALKSAFVNITNLSAYCTSNNLYMISCDKWLFYRDETLAELTIPEDVSEIGYRAFYGCSSIKSIYCKAATPPVGNELMFENNAPERKIYVPASSLEAYKSAAHWNRYASDIIGVEF